MIVRPATAPDFDTIADITRREILEGTAHFGTEPPTADELRADWLRTRDTYPYLVAADDEGPILGFAKAYAWKARGAYQHTCEVGVYVQPDAQGRGIGRLLYEALFPELERCGFHTIIAGIALPNEPSVKLHERMRMRYIGTLPHVGRKFDKWIDVGYWVRVLDGPLSSRTE